MANITINHLPVIGTVANDDEVALWDSSGNVTGKVTRLNLIGATITGGGTIATGGNTLTVPATGTAALLGTANTFTADQTINGTLAAGHMRTRSDALSDDSVISFTPVASAGLLLISSTSNASMAGLIAYRAISGAFAAIVSGGANLEVSTSVLAGTTGTDGKVTVSANANGNIYIENRLGGTLTIRTVFMG